MQMSSPPSTLGSHLSMEICVQGWDFHLQEDRVVLQVILLLCVCSDPTLETCTSQLCVCSRDFSRETAKAGGTSRGATRGPGCTSWITHRETALIKHTSCWIITAPVNNPPCTYCSLQKAAIREIFQGEQSAALSCSAPRPRVSARLGTICCPKGRDNNGTAPLPQTASPPRLPRAQPQGPAAEWMELETIQTLHSRPLRRPRPPNAHTSDFLAAHGESSQSQMGLLRELLVFYSKMEEGKVILF